MLRRALTLAVVLATTWVGSTRALGQEDMRIATQFIQGLRDRGYYDLADEFLERLRTDPNTPQELRATVDYEQGRLMIDEASKTGDLVQRKDLLDKARIKLVAFTDNNPKHPQAPEAYVQLARLLVERGHLAMLRSGDAENAKEKAAFLAEARGSFDQARVAYTKADDTLVAKFKTFPPFLPENDKRKEERDRTHTAMMDAELQKAVVEYEQGQTFPLESKERAEYLAKGLAQFEDIYKRYRTQFAGLTARMWQAKCYEEKGDIGPALGIYNELLEHQDSRLRGLQRHVAYFKIIAHAKRKDHALAADLANSWLRMFNTNEDHRSREGLGVQLELAKNLVAQLPEAEEKERGPAIRRVTDILRQVVSVASPHKAEALELLRKYKPNAAPNADNLAKMTYEELMGQADQAIAAHEWDKAALALKFAIRKADPTKDPDKANLPRYNLAYCYYMNKQYYEADVLTEFLARRYPFKSLSSKATEIGMASLADAYNTYREIDRASDLNRLIDLAKYTAATWPDKDEGDVARMTLGQIYDGMGNHDAAIAAYEAIKPKASKWVEAQTKVGASHWEKSKALRRNGDDKGAEAEVAKALGALNAALKARQDAGTAASDTGLLGNVCDIADIELETGKAEDALKRLDPIAKAAQGLETPPLALNRVVVDLLRAHIATNQVDLAQADMAILEKNGGGGNSLAQLYFSLGKLLEKEMKTLKEKRDGAGLARTQAAYQKFLAALVQAKAGQTYESLEWAGENMLTLGNPKEAGEVFKRILDTVGKDKAFLAQTGAQANLLRTRLKLSASLRGRRDYTGAEVLIDELKKESPRALEPMLEEGLLLEDKAAAGLGKWAASYAFWQKLALRLSGSRPKPPEYFDAWYHAGYALFKDGQPTKAKQTLGSIIRLSPTLGGPEMKAKYLELLKQIK